MNQTLGWNDFSGGNTIVDVGVDTLAIAVSHHRSGVTAGTFLATLHKSQEISPHDLATANQISDHFKKQIMVTELRTGRLSDFQRAVRKYLEGDRTKYIVDDCGLIYSLPQFYERDIKFGEMVDRHYWGSPDRRKLEAFNSGRFRVTPVTKHQVSTKHRKVWTYWFKDVTNGAAIMVEIPMTNELLWLWDKTFERGEVVIMTAARTAIRQHPADLAYIKLGGWKIVE